MEEEKSLFSPGMEAFFAREKQDKLMRYRHLNRFCKKGQIVLAGSSLMEQFPIYELMQDFDLPLTIYNRGIGGYVSRDMLAALDVQVLELAPSKLFINIGTNDIGNGIEDELYANYETILRRVREALPRCKMYVMAYFPCNDRDDLGLPAAVKAGMFAHRTPRSILAANKKVQALAEKMGCTYIDVNRGLTDDRGLLKAEYCIDGVHFYADGYVPVLGNLRPYLEE